MSLLYVVPLVALDFPRTAVRLGIRGLKEYVAMFSYFREKLSRSNGKKKKSQVFQWYFYTARETENIYSLGNPIILCLCLCESAVVEQKRDRRANLTTVCNSYLEYLENYHFFSFALFILPG